MGYYLALGLIRDWNRNRILSVLENPEYFYRPIEYNLRFASLVLQYHIQKEIADRKYFDFTSYGLGHRCFIPC